MGGKWGHVSPLKGKPRPQKIHDILIRGELHRGHKHSEATREKMSQAWKTRAPASDATRKKVSDRVKGEKHPMYGKHPSAATLKKQSDSHIGHHLTESQKKKIRQSNIGHYAPSGENSPGWKGGISFEPYCPRFNNKFKERVRTFFGYQCVECGTPQIERKLHVHHVNFRKDTCCSKDVTPLFVALCDSCHGKTGYNREYWQQHFTEIINTYYGGKCYFTVEEMSQLRLITNEGEQCPSIA